MKRKPCLLLALAGKGQVADGRAVDLLGAVKPANAGQKITERKDAADGDVGEAEGRSDVIEFATATISKCPAVPLGRTRSVWMTPHLRTVGRISLTSGALRPYRMFILLTLSLS